MKEQLISFETARLAEQKGFDFAEYLKINDEAPLNLNSNYNPKEYQPWFLNVTQGLMQKWLREIHKIHINPAYDHIRGTGYLVWFFNEDEMHSDIFDNQYKSYEEALEVGLLEGLIKSEIIR